jgi:hypothetical protein
MSILLTGISEIIPLYCDPALEAADMKEVEEILPGSWDKFKAICLMAKSEMDIVSKNKTSVIRKELLGLQTLSAKMLKKYLKLTPATQALLPAKTSDLIQELTGNFESVASNIENLPDGKQRLHHRDYMATKIAILMLDRGVTPRLNRDILSADAWGGDDKYARLLRIAVIAVEGRDPSDLYPHLERGLKK